VSLKHVQKGRKRGHQARAGNTLDQRIDPDRDREFGRRRVSTDETFGMSLVSQAQDVLAPLAQLWRPTVVNCRRRHQAEAQMAVLEVVPGEEVPAPNPGWSCPVLVDR